MDVSDIKKKMEIQLRMKKQEQERKEALKKSKKASSNSNNLLKQIRSTVKEVVIPADGLALRQLASSLSMKVNDLVAKLEELGELDGVMRQTSRPESKDAFKKKKKNSKTKGRRSVY